MITVFFQCAGLGAKWHSHGLAPFIFPYLHLALCPYLQYTPLLPVPLLCQRTTQDDKRQTMCAFKGLVLILLAGSISFFIILLQSADSRRVGFSNCSMWAQ